MNSRGPQQNSCNRIYEPYMLGSSYGVGVSASSPGIGSPRNSQGRRECVRDCLLWSDTQAGNGANLGGGNDGYYNNFNFNTSINAPFNEIPQPSYRNPGKGQSVQYQQQQPKAFVSVPGGEGLVPPVSIPCQIAPIGTNPASLIQPMQPVTLRVNAPTPSMTENGGRGPMTFTINPEQLFRAQQQQQQQY